MKPLLKWAGSKSKYSDFLVSKIPDNINGYIEPFFGSGAVFFELFDINRDTKCDVVVLSDINEKLMNCYITIKNYVQEFINELRVINDFHNKYGNVAYKQVVKNFNKLDSIKRAAAFYYLNKSSFNGIWRENSNGEYNVPWNQKEKINICKDEKFHKISALLNRVSPICAYYDFESIITSQNFLKSDIFFFLDPPYIPVSETSNFTSYNKIKWEVSDNKRLQKCMIRINEKGGKFLLTNSNAPETRNVFNGWNIEEIQCSRFIKAVKPKENRNKITELIITNY